MCRNLDKQQNLWNSHKLKIHIIYGWYFTRKII
jgi:hypothetical protein